MRYMHCAHCRKRMVRFMKMPSQWYYICRHCGSRWTYFPDINALGDDWPHRVIRRAIVHRVIAADGRVLLDQD